MASSWLHLRRKRAGSSPLRVPLFGDANEGIARSNCDEFHAAKYESATVRMQRYEGLAGRGNSRWPNARLDVTIGPIQSSRVICPTQRGCVVALFGGERSACGGVASIR